MAERIGEIVRRLRGEKGWSQNRLAHAISDLRGKALEPAFISHLETGRAPAAHPTTEMMEMIAESLGVDPRIFVEYRLALVRRTLSEHGPEHRYSPGIGLELAAANLEELAAGRVPPDVLSAAAAAARPAPVGEIAEAALEATEQARRATRRSSAKRRRTPRRQAK